jgi:hypothetical protein
MIGLNCDYKYFSGMKNPIEIINKYRSRGYGILTNNSESENIFKYNTSRLCSDIRHSFDVTSILASPLYTLKNLKYSITYNDNIAYISDLDKLVEWYKTKYQYDTNEFGFDLFRFTTISNEGTIKPYQNWIQQIYYDIVNKFTQ